MGYVWVLERTLNAKFPYRLQILEGNRPWLSLRVQDRWPGANQNIFCLRELEPPRPEEALEEVERLGVIAVQQRGPRLSIVLDRARQKRCDFLFLKRDYKNQPGASYEQIFWQTQQSMRQRRPGAHLTVRKAASNLTVQIASDERYPWRFPASRVVRGRLQVGDYALVEEEQVLAVVERKTFDNLLADFGTMPILHQRLLELATIEHHALVIEASYEDFLTPKKLHHYSPAFCAAAIADLYVHHPRLRVVFCANRKTANAWVQEYFNALWANWDGGPARGAEAAQTKLDRQDGLWAGDRS